MRSKMTLDDLKNLFPKYDPAGRRVIDSATKRGYKHVHKPTWKPPKAELTPAQWKAMRRKMSPKQWAQYVSKNIQRWELQQEK